ncbi:ABC-three component system protein [Oceanisphaera sp. IT1-181]|uniref:ABC-three component system protein n=1 Tax=Oceanisphaera sp. IT1-181 TaxID=3081199 RepID=UPI0029CA8BA8|nr:ABC-three component system protein [Oceanisphaera sp. IT1-181]
MIRRFRLEQKSYYEKLVIAQLLSDMLDRFLSGRSVPLLIGAEQGGIAEWDDVVIQHDADHWEHLQIKRQSTPFCEKHVDKADYLRSYKPRKKGKNPASSSEVESTTLESGALPADNHFDSELDKAIKSLAAWYHSNDAKNSPKRAFSLTLVGLDVAIKGKGKEVIRINHLHEFCDLCRQDGINLAAFEERDDKPTQLVYKWLTTWCGFSDWKHVQETMRLLTVKAIGDESTLKARAHESLGRHFIEPQRTLDLLLVYISENTTDVSAIGCHAAASHLQAMLRPDAETWTQYLTNPAPEQGWTVAGTHNLSAKPTFQPAHAASEVVSHHWGASTQNRKLRLYAKYSPPVPNTVALPSAILRLALHLKSGSHCLLLGEQVWRLGAENELGRTLGVGELDLDDLPWIENPEGLSCSLGRPLTTLLCARKESAALHSAMNDLVWEQLQRCVAAKLNTIADSDLMAAMDSKWQGWVTELTADQTARQLLLEQMMYPQAEGIDAKQALRIGPRTVELLETAIIMQLLVCVGIGVDDANWRSIPEFGGVLTIALHSWSGVPGDNYGVRPLSDDNLMSVLGPSPAPLVILSGVEASPTSLLDSGMADDSEAGNSMAAQRQPRLLVTRFRLLKQLRTGTLADLKSKYQHHLNDWRMTRTAAMKDNGKGY